MPAHAGLRGLTSLCTRSATASSSRLPFRPTPVRPGGMAMAFSTSVRLGVADRGSGRNKGGKVSGKGAGWTPARNPFGGSKVPALGKRGAVVQDPKIKNILRQLMLMRPHSIPPPLRMARNRHLRHWTIHRAWLLYRRQRREARERALMQLHNSMSKACETLRATAGPGSRPEGYLYRVAMEKKGVWGPQGIPIEYARPQTETPAREAWNHDWKR